MYRVYVSDRRRMGYQQAAEAEAEAGGWPPQQQASQVGGLITYQDSRGGTVAG